MSSMKKRLIALFYKDQGGSDRKVTYFLMEKYEYMFLKIIDINPERKNTLNLEEILSFG